MVKPQGKRGRKPVPIDLILKKIEDKRQALLDAVKQIQLFETIEETETKLELQVPKKKRVSFCDTTLRLAVPNYYK
jgi:hypothetical protein